MTNVTECYWIKTKGYGDSLKGLPTEHKNERAFFNNKLIINFISTRIQVQEVHSWKIITYLIISYLQYKYGIFLAHLPQCTYFKIIELIIYTTLFMVELTKNIT